MRRLCLVLAVGFLLAAAPPPRPKGAVVLVGGGRLPATVEKAFLQLAGGPKARLVVIPTASVFADVPKEEESFLQRWRKAGVASVKLLHTKRRSEADSERFVLPLREATGVWLSGGDQSRLTAAYRGTEVERELKRLLARGGVLGGTSAGAAVAGDVMITGGQREATTGPGLGLVPGVVVDQHFLKRDRVERLLGVLAREPAQVGLGIDEATAVIVRGREIEVVGDSYVMLFTPGGKGPRVQVLRAGGRGTLAGKRR